MMMRRAILATSTAAILIGLSLGLGACGPADPFFVEPPDDCSVESQNQFVVDAMAEFYLWSDELPVEVDVMAYETPEDLVSELRQGVDRWTRIRDKSTSDALFMEGKFVGLGYKTLRGPEDEVRMSFVSDNSPASAAAIVRGDKIVSVNGVTVAELDENNSWSATYGPNEPGVDVDLEIEKLDTGEIVSVTLTKGWIDIVSIPVAEVLELSDGTKVGYYIMDKFVETTKAELEAAYAMFKDAGVGPVIIDMRYNGGGLISVAERQVNLSVGADHKGEVAYTFEYNGNYAHENRSTKISNLDSSLGADEIVVLTSSRTLSASELVINALFPYADVALIGGPTGGKPVGSRSFEFCEKLLFPITFRLVNAAGNTDYFEGLPADCFAEDDLFHQLGDPDEGMLAAGLAYLDQGSCAAQPYPPPGVPPRMVQRDSVGETVLPQALAREDIDSW